MRIFLTHMYSMYTHADVANDLYGILYRSF